VMMVGVMAERTKCSLLKDTHSSLPALVDKKPQSCTPLQERKAALFSMRPPCACLAVQVRV
jgi:hypothetical protein